ncbi:tellurium resistance protein TerZ [Sediminihabitans luteus]|uniref:Tellurium resistance protein TerZ n=1 Tax=Sediminihabitans luteus TaxID=1138585 RepID=A0A2M9CBY0_9CELL|nr:TerD family protein [Sediminihabitans luteus]PJJ68589.1 tellurium resistance protein TerZ [Sediminihabitans luteus]GII99927.1 export associated protein [Sediminihabitans luteus]
MSINLSKGQSINLAKSTGGGLTTVRLGLGWDVKVVQKKGLFGGVKNVQKSIDLDASALLVGGGAVRDVVYYGQLRSKDASVQHTGDNLTGAGDGDDESILVDLTKVAASIDHIVFTVNSYSGDNFSEIENAYVRVVDSASRDAELAKFVLTGSGPHTALVMARVSRTATGWEFTAIGTPGNGRTAHDLMPLALGAL